MVTQIYRETFVPILGCHAIERMPIVSGGVVDQDRYRAPVLVDPIEHGAQRANIAHVARMVRDSRWHKLCDKHLGRLFGQVTERDARALLREARDEVGTDS